MSRESNLLDIFIGLVLAFAVAAPICAGITSYSASILWKWFLVREYGTGPSLGAWYGIAMLVALFTSSFKRDHVDDDSMIMTMLFLILKCVLLCIITLMMAGVVRKMNGW